MKKSSEQLNTQAGKLLVQAGAFSVPVDLNRIAQHLKLTVHEKPLEEEFSGFLAVPEKAIVVNKSHPPARRRFTVAHEIGHYILHAKKNPDADVFIDRAVYFRKKVATSNTNHQTEMEANFFAAGLLMPEALIERYLEDNGWVDLDKSDDIKALASEFDVSTQAMSYRLRNLGFVLSTSF